MGEKVVYSDILGLSIVLGASVFLHPRLCQARTHRLIILLWTCSELASRFLRRSLLKCNVRSPERCVSYTDLEFSSRAKITLFGMSRRSIAHTDVTRFVL